MAFDITSQINKYQTSEKGLAILELQDEMRKKGAEIFALYYDTIAGFEKLTRHLVRSRRKWVTGASGRALNKTDNILRRLEPLLVRAPPHGYRDKFGDFARTLQDYKDRILPGGRNSALVGNYLIIALYQHWEDLWRGRIADALKISDTNGIKSYFWGDLRLIRICLIHKKGFADAAVASKSTMFRWFKEGQTITIDHQKIEAIIAGFFNFIYVELFGYEKQLTVATENHDGKHAEELLSGQPSPEGSHPVEGTQF